MPPLPARRHSNGPQSRPLSCAPRNQTQSLPPILLQLAQIAISSQRPVPRPPAAGFRRSLSCSSLSRPRKLSLRFLLCRSRSCAAPALDNPAVSWFVLFVLPCPTNFP